MLVRRRALAVSLSALLLLSCTGEGEAQPDPIGPTDEPQPGETEAGDPEPTPTPEPIDAQPVLDDEWYVDSNGDGLPDFIAEEMGLDPEGDPCADAVDCPGPGGALEYVEREQNVLLVLDASGSMAGTAGGGVTKMQAAKDALERYVLASPDWVNIGFMVYGHTGSNRAEGRAESCQGIELLEPLGGVTPDTIRPTLDRFSETGYTPLAAALAESRAAFADVAPDAVNRIIMVSDGIETCDGDPIGEAQALMDSGFEVVIDVVGFDVPDAETAQLREIAAVGQGTYTDARSTSDLQGYFADQERLVRELLDQFICIVGNTNELTDCYGELADRISDVVGRYEDEAESGAEAQEIGAIRRAASDHYQEQSRTSLEVGTDLERRVFEQADEIQQRIFERYGEDVSADFRCLRGLV